MHGSGRARVESEDGVSEVLDVPEKMQVRLASLDDFDELVELYRAVGAAVAGTDNDPIWEVGVYPTLDEIKAHIEADEIHVCMMDGRIAGAVAMVGGGDEGYEDVAWVSSIPVRDSVIVHLFGMHPDFKGQGLARPFFEAVEEALRSRGERILRLDVVGANKGAQAVYERLGFTSCGTAWLAYPDYQGEFAFFEKEL